MMSVKMLIIAVGVAMAHIHHYYRDTPIQDECRNVNAVEPPECPDTIGPPCPPCYTNMVRDYIKGDSLDFTENERDLMRYYIDFYNNYWSDNYPPSKVADGYGIYSGSGGRAQIFLRQYLYDRNNETLLNIAEEYIDKTLDILPEKQYNPSYMEGFIGVWTLKAIMEDIKGNNTAVEIYLDNIVNTVNNVNIAIINGESMSSDGINMTLTDMEQGLAGMIYNGILLNTLFDREIIDIQAIYNITIHVLDVGIQNGIYLNGNYLAYKFFLNGQCYLYGPNHGASGTIHQLYNAYTKYPNEFGFLFTNEKYYNAIKNTLDFYINIQLSDGNIPTNCNGACANNYGNDSDARVQFCHGAPGFINVFSQSALLFAKINATAAQKYLDTAIITANVTWNRGLLVKGTMFCHGIGANANMFWQFGNILEDIQALNSDVFKEYDLENLKNTMYWRTKQFILWTLNDYNLNKTRIYDSNEGYSMFAGNFAIHMSYVKLLINNWYENEKVCHPGWNLCI